MSTKTQPMTKYSLVQLGVQVAKCTPRRAIMAQNPAYPERLVRELQRVGLGQAEYITLVRNELLETVREIVASFREDLHAGKVTPSTKAIAAGIFTDKFAVLTGSASMEAVDTGAMVGWSGSKSREELIASLRGEPKPTFAG